MRPPPKFASSGVTSGQDSDLGRQDVRQREHLLAQHLDGGDKLIGGPVEEILAHAQIRAHPGGGIALVSLSR